MYVSALLKARHWQNVPAHYGNKLPKAHLFLHRGDEILLVKQIRSGNLGLPKGGLQPDFHNNEKQSWATVTGGAALPCVRGICIDSYRVLYRMATGLRQNKSQWLAFVSEWVHWCVLVMVAAELWEETGLTLADLEGVWTLVWGAWGVGFTAEVRKRVTCLPRGKGRQEIEFTWWATRSAIAGIPPDSFNSIFHHAYPTLYRMHPLTRRGDLFIDHGHSPRAVAVDDGIMELDG